MMGRPVRPAPKLRDSDEHGTHTAGTIAGRPVGGRHVGVAPGSALASALVIEGGTPWPGCSGEWTGRSGPGRAS